MFTLKRLIGGSLFVFVLAGTTLAQENRAPIEKPGEPVATGPLVTAAATAKRVRFVSPGTVVQLRLEVYNETGQKLFDTELHGGNVLDWHLQDGAGQRLQTGSYACVLTTKSLSGRLSQRVGLVTVNDKKAAIEAAGGAQLSLAQQQTIGPVEGNAAFTILQESEAEAITAVTHDGSDGQVARTRGALSFRVGDFFSGKDKEQMRLTEEGNLGIGTDNPRAKLEVAGDISARGTVRTDKVEFADGTVQTTGLSGRKLADGTLAPNATGTGTQNRIAKWMDNAGTLGDSILEESGLNLIHRGSNIRMTAPPSPAAEANLLFLDANNKSLGVLASSTPSFGAANGPYFAMRGNLFTQIANQRGIFAISAGQVASPGPLEGSIRFFTGNDVLSLFLKHDGKVGIGTSSPNAATKLDVVGAINTSTQYDIGGLRVLSISGSMAEPNSNTFAGVAAGTSNTTGFSNSFFGREAGRENTEGFGNSFFGFQAGLSNTTADYNAFFGKQAGALNTTGGSNAFFGGNAGFANTEGGGNSFFGRDAGFNNSTGGSNSFFGAFAGGTNTTGASNSFFGRDAGKNNMEGASNSFFGTNAGFANTTGGGNSFFGRKAGESNTEGANNCFFGYLAGNVNTTGAGNSFFGTGVGQANTGDNNSFFGMNAGFANAGAGNSFFGRNAGQFNTTGAGNIIIGDSAGSVLVSGNNNIYLAANAAAAAESNTIRIGTQGTQTASFIAGISGTVVAGSAVMVTASGQLGIAGPSSRRYKKDIRDMGDASSKLMRLHPVTFRYKPEFVDWPQTLQYGLVAEEVAKVYPELVHYTADGKPQTVHYHLLNTMLLNEVQKQQRHIQSQEHQLATQSQQISSLETRLRRVETGASRRQRARRR